MTNAPHSRIDHLDVARSLALLGMVVFHLTYDLVMFGVLPPDTIQSGYFYYHARAVAGSFLALAGVGLWLSHGQEIRWAAFLRRLAKVSAAALAVTIATALAMPSFYVFFGILHAIALFSVIGLATLRLPAVVNFALAALIYWVSYTQVSDSFNGAWLQILGLSTERPQTMDFEPIFPWLAPVLLGIGIGQLGSRFGLWDALAAQHRSALLRRLGTPGRHSLVIYLIHQPILMGLVWLGTQIF